MRSQLPSIFRHLVLIVLLTSCNGNLPMPTTPTQQEVSFSPPAPSDTPVPTNTSIPTTTPLPTNTSTPTNPPAPFISISKPTLIVTCQNEDAFCRFEVQGTAGGIASFANFRIYVFVFPVNPPGEGWYLQRQVASVNSDGSWIQSPSYIGNTQFPAETNHTLRLKAMIASEDATYDGTRLEDLVQTGGNNPIVVHVLESIDGYIVISDLVELTISRP